MKSEIMSSNIFVSVVVCTFNRVGLLRECLESLVSQSYDNFEVFVVDDGSSDGTLDFLKSFSEAHSVVNFLTQENSGPSVARNKGILGARGEIICITDDDCVVDKDWIKNFVNAFSDDSTYGVGGKIEGCKPVNIIERYAEKNGLLNQENFSEIFLLTANAAFRKSCLDEIGGFDEHFYHMGGEDTDLGIMIKLMGGKLRYTPDAVVLHKHRSTLKDLMKQSYGYGKGYGFLHKKYTKQFHPKKRVKYFLKTILKKIIFAPVRIMKSFTSNDKALCLLEPYIDILVLSSECLGVIKETLNKKVYPGEKQNNKIKFIEDAKLPHKWGI